jgi:hypothetical protein
MLPFIKKYIINNILLNLTKSLNESIIKSYTELLLLSIQFVHSHELSYSLADLLQLK